MAATFQLRLPVDAEPERVFAGLRDLDSCRLWMPDDVRIERLVGDGPIEAGDEWREVRTVFGREAGEVFEVVACEPPRRLELRVDGSRGASGKGNFHFHYQVEPAGEGARIRLDGRLEMPGLFSRLLARLMVVPFRRACEKDLRAFAAWIEGGGA